MASEPFSIRLADLERRLASIETHLDDYSAVKARGIRNESEISLAKHELAEDLKGLRQELIALRQAINVAAIGFASTALIVAATIFTVFR